MHLFGTPAIHCHFSPAGTKRGGFAVAKSRSFGAVSSLRSTPKARTYAAEFDSSPVIVKRFYDEGAFVSELLVYELLKGESYVPTLRDINGARTRLIMQRIDTTRAASTAEDLEFLFKTLGLIHGKWEEVWRSCKLDSAIQPFRISDGASISRQERPILAAFEPLLQDGYCPLSIGDVKLEHVLVRGEERFVIDFDASAIGRLDATDLVLGISYCPENLCVDVAHHLRAYDSARASCGSKVGALATFADEIVCLAERWRLHRGRLVLGNPR